MKKQKTFYFADKDIVLAHVLTISSRNEEQGSAWYIDVEFLNGKIMTERIFDKEHCHTKMITLTTDETSRSRAEISKEEFDEANKLLPILEKKFKDQVFERIEKIKKALP